MWEILGSKGVGEDVRMLDLGITGHGRGVSVGEARAAFAFVFFHLEWLFTCTGVCRGSMFGLSWGYSSCAVVR